MTKERAQWLLANAGRYGELQWAYEEREIFHLPHKAWITDHGITREEYGYIACIRDIQGPNASIFTAVDAIAKGIG